MMPNSHPLMILSVVHTCPFGPTPPPNAAYIQQQLYAILEPLHFHQRAAIPTAASPATANWRSISKHRRGTEPPKGGYPWKKYVLVHFHALLN